MFHPTDGLSLAAAGPLVFQSEKSDNSGAAASIAATEMIIGEVALVSALVAASTAAHDASVTARTSCSDGASLDWFLL